jgi:hypothetical protein
MAGACLGMAWDPYQQRLARARSKATRKAKAKAWVLAYLLAHPCVDCSETDPKVLEFDHRDPALKRHTIARMVADGLGVKNIEQEVAKCDVRCCNCHRRRSLDEGHGGFRRM